MRRQFAAGGVTAENQARGCAFWGVVPGMVVLREGPAGD
jgi:hypothetical protein